MEVEISTTPTKAQPTQQVGYRLVYDNSPGKSAAPSVLTRVRISGGLSPSRTARQESFLKMEMEMAFSENTPYPSWYLILQLR